MATESPNGDTIPPLKLDSYRPDKDNQEGSLLKFRCPKILVEHIKNVQKGVVCSTHGAVAVYWKGQILTPARPVTFQGREMIQAAPTSVGRGGARAESPSWKNKKMGVHP